MYDRVLTICHCCYEGFNRTFLRYGGITNIESSNRLTMHRSGSYGGSADVRDAFVKLACYH